MTSSPRLLKFGRRYDGALSSNVNHNWAAGYALKIYHSNSIYTFIPKNGCSTMRLSIGVANQCIKDVTDVNWIHSNNATFRASLQDLIIADYTFVILRDPFTRLASCFLDKIVSKDGPAWALRNAIKGDIDVEDLTFPEFVQLVSRPDILFKNEHWRPQEDFLVYEAYDEYFALEDFENAQKLIQNKARMDIIDARPHTKHGIDRFEILPQAEINYSLNVWKINQIMRSGFCPHPLSLFDENTISVVRKTFERDIELYEQRTGKKVVF